jgi:hypothetical protein
MLGNVIPGVAVGDTVTEMVLEDCPTVCVVVIVDVVSFCSVVDIKLHPDTNTRDKTRHNEIVESARFLIFTDAPPFAY